MIFKDLIQNEKTKLKLEKDQSKKGNQRKMLDHVNSWEEMLDNL
jgi:hypothetical protein